MSESKFKYYVHKLTGEVLAALKFPAGYEDAHPNEFEGFHTHEEAKASVTKVEDDVKGPASTDDTTPPAPPVPPVPADTTPTAPAPIVPVDGAPSAGDTGTTDTPNA